MPRRVLRQLLCSPCLADAGFAGEHGDSPAPHNRLFKRSAQHLKLALTPDECVSRRGHGSLPSGNFGCAILAQAPSTPKRANADFAMVPR